MLRSEKNQLFTLGLAGAAWVILSCPVLVGCSDKAGDGGVDAGVDSGVDGGVDAGVEDAPWDLDWHEVTLTPAGGNHTLPNGLTVEVPAGAVDEDTPIELRHIPYEEFAFLYGPLGVPEEDVVASFEAEPDGLTFNKAITITLPAPRLKTHRMYLLYIADMVEQQVRSPAGTALTVDFTAETVAMELDHFTGASVGAIPPEKQECHRSNPKTATNCKCEGYRYVNSDLSAMCSVGDCVISGSHMVMEFIACSDGPFESDWQQVSDGCKASMEMSAARTAIPEGETENINSTVKLGCATWKDVNVAFEKTSGVGSLETTDDVTDQNGKAVALFHAGSEEGEAEIKASTTFEYYA